MRTFLDLSGWWKKPIDIGLTWLVVIMLISIKSTLISWRCTLVGHFLNQNHRRKKIINSEKAQSTFSAVNSRTRRSLLLFFLLFVSTTWPCVQSKYYDETSSEELYGRNNVEGNSTVRMSPPVLNLATRADIFVNATCGEREPETYCKLVEHVHSSRTRTSQCQVCDDQAGKGKRHPIKYAIDGSNRWWMSPTLANGRQYEWVTITIDLKQVYQVAYLVIKAAISPRPGNWILERSLDGIVFMPWQYFAINDDECWNRYRIRAKPGKPQYNDDEEVICTSYYSSLYPLEGGETHISLVNNRPGGDGPSETLTKFTMARYVRLRLQKIRTLHGDLMNVGGPERSLDKSVMRRYFYSFRDISIGGHCVCFGHASECVMDVKSQSEKCMCQHNTCGDRCDVCCPLFNQYSWGPGNSTARAACEPCQCHGQADSCVFDPVIAEKRLSINTLGVMDGGGVCLDCKAHTSGINCEKCEVGYYRPKGVLRNDLRPCVKCECDSFGSLGSCVADDDEALLVGKEPGSCVCKEGFTGKYCNQCEMGYRGYPTCKTCPCNLPGIVNMECEGDCICKENVQGNLCTECKKGYYNLIKENPEGCTQCFCHLVTDKCESSNFAITQVVDQDNWFVTDLHGTKVIALSSNGGLHHIANEEFNAYSMYYWGNAKAFSGNRVLSYGLNMIFHVSWVHARGDTSGRPITDYDLIIQSTNNMLAFSNNFYEGDNVTVHVTLNEMDCFVLPDIDNNIIQRTPTPKLGTPCTRFDVMEGIHDVKRLLIRAKYHTDQIEGMLSYALMEKADPNTITGPGERAATSVEVCSCPKEYTGTSCQDCTYGYRKSSKDSWPNECLKCDCNGHSPTCDFDGKCLGCEHNTLGDRCQFCKDGFYGNASSESPFSCKPCECPLSIETNNFSPTCQMSGNSYECTSCPDGYEGPFCERCANNFFGNPNQPGDYCKPCACNLEDKSPSSDNNICDHLTGECLVCPRNTVGWNCDECLPGHYGNPLNGTCRPCGCNAIGSVSDASCHPESGQCVCKDHFIGTKCDQCVEGHGSPSEGCMSCGCNPLGSQSTDCDKVTGQCKCKPGIGGRYCNKCLDLHFGFSSNGCLECNCHPYGSDSAVCDLNNGNCHCLVNVKGRKCDSCESGYWNINCGTGCAKCDCDPIGSVDGNCDVETGQCLCKQGVGGLRCDRCLDNCYGFNEAGCKVCDPCIKPGHICDSSSGRCACPPNTEGALCEKCRVGYWGNPHLGCQPCNCSQQGSTTPQCSSETGKCSCASGFEGDKCNKCKTGHYNYPHCTPCMCDTHGTDERFCNSEGQCSCSDSGHCHCKENVIGAKCDRCREGTYGLDLDNPEGCIECFCFHRTNKCSQGYFKWQRLVLPADRQVIPSRRSENQLNIVNNLIVIPDHAKDVIIEKDISFSAPLYWQLPHIFLGDKILSYNGFLRFRTHSIAGSTLFPSRVLSSYPLVQIQRNPQLILEYFPETEHSMGFHEVRLHEDEWRLKNGPFNGVVTKETMMVALHNLHHILIRGTHSPEVLNATLFNVSLDIAIPLPNGDKSMAHGIEVCDCPPQYNSTSCQNPRVGYYRWYKRDYITSTVIIDLVGEARPCQCNDRSNVCDTETGFCQNCSENTGGRYCEECAIGFYGDPFHKCLACPCPSTWNNHAESCYKPPLSNQFKCFCKPGYTGKSCERCDYGFFGNASSEFYGEPSRCKTGYYGFPDCKPCDCPSTGSCDPANGACIYPPHNGGHCRPCNCNEYGSVSDECHEVTGQCNCRPGVTGKDCSKCSTRHVIIGKQCTSCDDQCTGVLLNNVEEMSNDIKYVHIDKEAVSAIIQLMKMDNISKNLLDKTENRLIVKTFLGDIPTYETLGEIMNARADELEQSCGDAFIEVHGTKRKSQDLINKINLMKNEVRGTIIFLDDYVQGKVVFEIDPSWAENEINEVLDKLRKVGDVIEGMTDQAEDELDDVNDLLENVLVKIFNSSAVSKLQEKMRKIRDNQEDLMQYISQANKNSDEAVRIAITAKEFLDTGRVNVDTIDNMTIEMDMKTVMTATSINEGRSVNKELEQVLLMLEDILTDLRNNTKEVEIRETNLFELVPLYRVSYAQPAFDHVEGLKIQAKYLESLLVRINGSESFSAVTAYQRITEGFEKAFQLAKNASKFATEARYKIDDFMTEFSIENIVDTSSDLIQEGLTLSGLVENSMRSNLSSCKSAIDSLKWRLKVANESVKHMNQKMEIFDDDTRLEELMERIDEISETVTEVSMSVMETETKIQNELQSRINGIKGGSSLDSVDAAVQVEKARSKLGQVKSQTIRAEKQEKDMQNSVDSVKDRMKYLKALIKQARHKANTVGVSIGPDDTGTCFRLFKWPVIDSATSIRFNFAPTKKSDSLLFYWPSSINDDFVSIEMVDRQIKASWELGSGLRTLIHPKKLVDISENSDDPDFWVQISLERVGSSVSLDVKPVLTYDAAPRLLRSTPTAIIYHNIDDELTLMDLSPDDLIHIGGMSKQMRQGLVTNGLSGCIHNLQVNQKSIGLWNFVGNEGCAPCVECPDLTDEPPTGDLEYYFDGRGYAVVDRLQSKAFNSKFFDFSVQFRTLSENGLIFLTVNEAVGQIISLELKEGKILLQVSHKWNDKSNSLRIESKGNDIYNSGEWVNVRAVWVFQKGTQTGKLMIGKKDFSQEKESSLPLSLEFYNAAYHLGGVSPSFDPVKWKELVNVVPYVGCMKNVLINNSPYDPLSGNYFGVESPCGGKDIFVTSFDGDGFAEFASQPMKKTFKFGFSFKTLSPTGLLMISTSAKSLDSPDEHYYAVYLENGQIRLQIGIPLGPVDLMGNGTRYDDGKFHSIRFVKKIRKLYLYVDDEEIADARLPKQSPTVSAPLNRGLFIGGTNLEIQQKIAETPLPVARGFSGCIQYFYFENELLSFNFPISHKNQNLGQCPKHHEYDPSAVPNHFLYPNTIGTLGINRYDIVGRFSEESCSTHEHIIESEDPLKSLQFGNTPNSFVTLSLDGSKTLKQRFNITFQFRTFYPDGLFFQGLKKKGNGGGQCLIAYLKEGQIIVKFFGERPQELVSPLSSLNDGQWHQISIVKAEDKLFLHVDNRNASQTKVSKIKAMSKLNIGGIPPQGHDCLENSIHKPETFKGCLKNFIINSHQINLETNHAVLNEVSPCFKNVERGTFFRGGSFAIYTYNLTLGNIMELQLDFRSDSKNGLLLSYIPNKSTKYPSFSIFLDDGKVIARETLSNDDFYEAVADFENEGSYACDGNWHSIRANYEKGSITLRVDNFEPIFALAEPNRPSYTNGNAVVGSLFIGGVEEGASRLSKKLQFHGCIRNISVNRHRKDWTDMALLMHVYLNSCPA